MDVLRRFGESATLRQLYSRLVAIMSATQRSMSGRAPLVALAVAVAIWEFPRWSTIVSRFIFGPDPHDPDTTDSEFLRQNSRIEEVKTSRYTYPGIRVFFKPHYEQKELPGSLPLLVFVHGLGGSVAQFESLLIHFHCRASCLAVDLPGCGRSKFTVKSWDAYNTDALVEFLEKVISRYVEEDQSIVLIGHSYGSLLSARVALPGNDVYSDLDTTRLDTVGLVGICPPANELQEISLKMGRILLSIPEPIFDLWRSWDRRGGVNSHSVTRFVGPNADETFRRLQLRFNSQSRTPVFRRMAWGMLPQFDFRMRNAIPALWGRLRIPVLLVTGESDHLTKPLEAQNIYKYRQHLLSKMAPPSHTSASHTFESESAASDTSNTQSGLTSNTNGPSLVFTSTNTSSTSRTSPDRSGRQDEKSAPSTPTSHSNPPIEIPPPPKPDIMSSIWYTAPSPAGHSLFYDPCFVNTVSDVIAGFLTTRVTGRFDLGWQLRFLARGGKWDVKNLAKWKAVEPISYPIADIFRAMKTLREVDDIHSPARLVEFWGDEIKDVIDISHDRPVYAPQGLIDGGIMYHKFPTVSKVPPTKEEVRAFIEKVDRIRTGRALDKMQRGKPSESEVIGYETVDSEDEYANYVNSSTQGDSEYVKPLIGVHCHYGFNRTGFFIVSYLIERCEYSVQGAIDEFAYKRPNGIRHAHFLETLWVRYGTPGSPGGSAKAAALRGGGTGEEAEWGE